MQVIRIQFISQNRNKGADIVSNSGLRVDWLGVSMDGGIETYKRMIEATLEMNRVPGLPMYPLGFECDSYRLYMQDGESIKEEIMKKEGKLVNKGMLSLSDAYPLGLLVFDHLVVWASEFDLIQDVIYAYEELGASHHITRVDLNTMIDFNMSFFSSGKYREYMKCRSKKGASEWGEKGTETIYFGDKRSRKMILARIYDKRKEVSKSKKQYMISEYDSWKDITSVEFELHRDGLKRWGINTIDNLMDRMYWLWKKCTDWLCFKDENDNYMEWWEEIRGVEIMKGIKVKRTYEEKEIDIDRLYRVIGGYIKTAISIDSKARSKLYSMIECAELSDEKRVVKYETESDDSSVYGGGVERSQDIPF